MGKAEMQFRVSHQHAGGDDSVNCKRRLAGPRTTVRSVFREKGVSEIKTGGIACILVNHADLYRQQTFQLLLMMLRLMSIKTVGL